MQVFVKGLADTTLCAMRLRGSMQRVVKILTDKASFGTAPSRLLPLSNVLLHSHAALDFGEYFPYSNLNGGHVPNSSGLTI